MKFENKQIKELYFDAIIDLFKDNDCEGFERGVAQLKVSDRKALLVYIFKGKESLPDINSVILVKLILDYL